MEKNVSKTRFTLPPNVNGRCRGRLSLCLHEIKWYCEEPTQFNWIQAQLIWWGEKYHTAATLKLKNTKNQKNSIVNEIHYNILTKISLFKNYLLSSESVELKLYSGTSNIDIGVGHIKIPGKLIEFIDAQLVNLTQVIGKFGTNCHILNAQNKRIGEIFVEYEMLHYDRILSKAEMQTEILISEHTTKNNDKQCIEIENNMNQSNLNTNKKITKKSHQKKSIAKLASRQSGWYEKVSLSNSKRLSSRSQSSSPLFNYLTGRPLGAGEENEAVKAMESTSPTESLIDLLSFDLNGLNFHEKSNNAETNVLDNIDCLRIKIDDLCLTKAGVREILSKNAQNNMNFSSGTFTIEIDLDTVLTKKRPFEKNVVISSKIIRTFSSSIESNLPCIQFKYHSIHNLSNFSIKSHNSYANGLVSLVVRYRDIESSVLQTIGTANFHLADVIHSTNFTFQHQCPVKITQSDIIIGRLSVKAELGCRNVHFGADYLEAIAFNSIDSNKNVLPSDHIYAFCSNEWRPMVHEMDELLHDTCLYDIHDDQYENKSDNSTTPLNLNTNNSNNLPKSNGNNLNNSVDEMSDKDHLQRLSKLDEVDDDATNGLSGLFHIGNINYCSWYELKSEMFLVCRPFWVDTAIVTENCQHKTNEENYKLNYLELFSVICDQKLFESTKHSFMSIEIWQHGTTDTLIGSAKVPLHQFFIAFNNNIIRTHVSRQELPIISIDGWVTIPFAASPNGTPIGTVETILALGTIKQINNFKKSKSLLLCNSFHKRPLEMYALQENCLHQIQTMSNITPNKMEANITNAGLLLTNERNSNLVTMFSSFIDNLAARLPERHLTSTEIATNDATTQTNNTDPNNIINVNSAGKYMRPTSELLDELQRALSIAPTPDQMNAISHSAVQTHQVLKAEPSICSNLSDNNKPSMFRLHIEIESALHLPSFSIQMNKKSGKRNRNTVNTTKKANSNTISNEPNTYATFEAAATNMSAHLSTYITNIFENSCSPQWNKSFEVYLSTDYLRNDEKRIVIRVWRKVTDSAPKTRLIPSASSDVTIGCASVDLSVLLAGLPSISGWFNIIDHSGCINGQLKIHIKPLDDLLIYKNRTQHDGNACGTNIEPALQSQSTTDALPLHHTFNKSHVIDDTALSRALKRKFTELEEITQRLRARLFDVTGNMAIDPDDQFENDLNTIPNEDDDDFEQSNIASQMSLDWLEHCHNQTTSNETHDKTNYIDASVTNQMCDIFDSLSTDLDANQSEETNKINDTAAQNTETLQLSNRFNDFQNDEIAFNQTDNNVENIADYLQKSLIND